MAESGRIILDVSSTNYISGYIEWSEGDVSIKDNTSVVTASLVYVHKGSVNTGNNSSDFYLTINGSKVERKNGYTLYPGNTYKVLTHSVTVEHAPDGSKSITIEGGGGINGTTGLSDSHGSGTVALTTIHRTVRVNADGTWERAVPWVNDEGTWKRSVPFVNKEGTWHHSV